MPGVRTPHWQLIRAPVAVYDAHGGGKGASVLTREELGRRIACERERAGLTQGQLAERVGVDRSAITRIERGRQSTDTLRLSAIADALGQSPSVFFAERTAEEPPELLLPAATEAALLPGACTPDEVLSDARNA